MTPFSRPSTFPRSAFWLLVLCLQLGACAGLRQTSVADWPEGLPPPDFFVAEYERDADLHDYQSREEYLYWISKFYTGTSLYPRGWNDVSESIIAQTGDPERIAVLQRELSRLGRDIAAEWAKDNSLRLVDNRHLAVWGMAAERAAGEGSVDATLEKINEDLQKLLTLELPADAITADRYHEPDPDDYFAL